MTSARACAIGYGRATTWRGVDETLDWYEARGLL